MKLVSVKKSINSETFAPEVILTIRIPIETVSDNLAIDGLDKTNTILGNEFSQMIREYRDELDKRKG